MPETRDPAAAGTSDTIVGLPPVRMTTRAYPDQAGNAPPLIRTPDQRLRVFVSSTLQELTAERAAARAAIAQLRLSPVLFELGARPHAPQDLYRAYLAQSDIFIGIYWERYGWVAPNMSISGLEDEYRLSGDRPKLIYVKTPATEREPRLKALLADIKSDETASYKPFETSEELRDLIENDLALLLTERFEAGRPVMPAREEAPTIARLRPLPVPPTPLVDREREQEAIRALLLHNEAALITLTGPGGAGKTRLALALAAGLQSQFVDGTAWITLAALTDSDQVAPTIAGALGVRENPGEPIAATLKRVLADAGLLLVVDNFEQVVKASTVLAELLESCPRLKILATSRRALRLRGEKTMPIPPLSVPDARKTTPPAQLTTYAAVDLFVQRAQSVKGDFTVTEANAQAIAEICRRLDGLPLAIELAAARVRVLPPKALLDRLDHALAMLTAGTRDLPARQQTMRAAIAWSYDLLDEPVKTLFRRLAAFSGGRTLEAAEAVCDPDGRMGVDILTGLETLVEESLLRAEENVEGEARFRMLTTVREYARELLVASDEAEAILRAHATYYLELAEQAEPHLVSASRWEWVERLEVEYDNLRAAWEWARAAGDSALCLRLVGSLGWFWFLRGHLAEGRGWIEAALAQAGPTADTAQRARALHWQAGLAFAQGDFATALAPIAQSVDLFRTLNDHRELAYSLLMHGLVLLARNDSVGAREKIAASIAIFRDHATERWGEAFALYCLGDGQMASANLDAARASYEESLALFQELEDRWGRAVVLHALGNVAVAQRDYSAARALFASAEALFRGLSDRWDLARVLLTQADAASHEGDDTQAERLCAESLALSRDLGNRHGILRGLGMLARIHASADDPDRAVRLLGVISSSVAPGAEAPALGSYGEPALIEALRAKLGEKAFTNAWMAGHAQSLDEAVASVTRGAAPAGSGPERSET